MTLAGQLVPIAINPEDPWLSRQAPGHDYLVSRFGDDFVSKVAGQIKLGFSPGNDEGAGQLVVRLLG